jgi:hypothetical protein
MRVLVVIAVLLTACEGQPAPSGPVPVTCHGIPDDICQNTDWMEMTNVSRSRVAEIVVTCEGSCGASGTADIEWVWTTGYRSGAQYTWDGGGG